MGAFSGRSAQLSIVEVIKVPTDEYFPSVVQIAEAVKMSVFSLCSLITAILFRLQNHV